MIFFVASKITDIDAYGSFAFIWRKIFFNSWPGRLQEIHALLTLHLKNHGSMLSIAYLIISKVMINQNWTLTLISLIGLLIPYINFMVGYGIPVHCVPCLKISWPGTHIKYISNVHPISMFLLACMPHFIYDLFSSDFISHDASVDILGRPIITLCAYFEICPPCHHTNPGFVLGRCVPSIAHGFQNWEKDQMGAS